MKRRPSQALIDKRAAAKRRRHAAGERTLARENCNTNLLMEIRHNLPHSEPVLSIIHAYAYHGREDERVLTVFSGLGFKERGYLELGTVSLGSLFVADSRWTGIDEILEYTSNDRQQTVLSPMMPVAQVTHVHRRFRHSKAQTVQMERFISNLWK